jgi:hypothetical protein
MKYLQKEGFSVPMASRKREECSKCKKEYAVYIKVNGELICLECNKQQ